MFRSLWFHRLLSLRRTRNVRRREAVPERRSIRPRLEGLEDRITPSGGPPLPLANPSDSTELQPDIHCVNANADPKYTINLPAETTTPLGQEQTLGSTAGWTLDGNGATLHAIRLHPLFTAPPDSDVPFDPLTLAGDAPPLGADGNSGLSAVLVSGNLTHEAALGDGIYVSQGGSLTLRGGAAVSDNLGQETLPAGGSVDLFAHGGGVFVSGISPISISPSGISSFAAGGEGAGGAGD